MSRSLDPAATDLSAYRDRLRKELLDSVVPFWMDHSLDREHGGYFTCLDRQGRVYDSRKYVWLQGRQVWTLSRLYRQIEPKHEWLDAARLGIEFLRKHARDAEGRYYFSLTRDGQPSGYQRKPYGAVFVMLGLLEYSRATGDPRYRDEAIQLFRAIDAWIRDPQRLGRPPLAGQPAASVLADRMVLLHMATELAAAGETGIETTIREYQQAILPHYDPSLRLLLENVALDGTPLRELPEGRLFNPGHSIEVAWMLLESLEYCPDEKLRHIALEVMEGSIERGWDQDSGGLFYFVDIEGKPTLQLESTMKLWWPHTEAMYALLRALLLTGEGSWRRWLDRVSNYAFDRFADPDYGEWFGYCDRAGERTKLCKGNNYKGCFHVPRFLLMSLQCLKEETP